VLVPSDSGRALFHVADLRFGACNSTYFCTGNNVLCLSSNVDLQGGYTTTFLQTPNISTFMQVSHVQPVFNFAMMYLHQLIVYI
jgi:hypothetical protein